MQQVVQGLTFSIDAGETLGIVGESGSGKSVTFLGMAGLLGRSRCQRSGQAYFTRSGHKQDLLKLSEAALRPLRGRHIGMVFQEPMSALNPVMRCGRQVAEVLQRHLGMDGREARKKVLALLEEMSLPDVARIYRAYPHELSGGQKQRIVLAQAVACEPALLVADEPTTALDVTVQQTVLGLIRRLQKERGMAVAFISHDLGVVRQVADRVLVMRRGRPIETNTTQALYEHPQMPYTRGLLACRPPLHESLQRLPTLEDWEAHPDRSPADLRARLRRTDGELREGREKRYAQAPLLRLERLEVQFPGKRPSFWKARSMHTILPSIDLVLYPGETLGLVGESGSGKTTLGRSLLRLLRVSDGNLWRYDELIRWDDAARWKQLRRQWQFVFQDPYASLNPRMSIGAAIAEPIRVHGLRKGGKAIRQRAEELLEQVGLPPDWYQRYPHQLSGGQRQRVGIARALAVEPELLICDEAVSALDTSVQAQVLNQLNELKRLYGLTYLFITHDFSVVRFMADRIIVMKEGSIEEENFGEQLIEHPKSDYTRRLIEAVPS